MDSEAFIARWTAREVGAERANYQMYLTELCDSLGVPRPDPAGADTQRNDYVSERAVRPRESDGGTAPKRIDLYKRGHFILEAKQSRLPGQKKALAVGQSSLFADEPEQLGRRTAARGWNVMMQNARRQAEQYVFLLDPEHPTPPFLVTCDIGHGFEVFADFTGRGRATAEAYGWPQDLTDEEILERLVARNVGRAREAADGHVRWLRPDYQIPRFGQGAAAKTGELHLGETLVALDTGLPAFPKDRAEQPLAVEAVLRSAAKPMDAAAIARAFKRGGKRIEAWVAQILATLSLYGQIVEVADGRFLARRAA